MVCEVCDMVLELVHEVLQLLTWYMGHCELADEFGSHGVACVVRCEVVHAQVCMYVYVSVYSK